MSEGLVSDHLPPAFADGASTSYPRTDTRSIHDFALQCCSFVPEAVPLRFPSAVDLWLAAGLKEQ